MYSGQAFQWNLTLAYAQLQHVKIGGAIVNVSDCGHGQILTVIVNVNGCNKQSNGPHRTMAENRSDYNDFERNQVGSNPPDEPLISGGCTGAIGGVHASP